ncbi:MAG TPA: TatD family hydrolase [bacterium]|mgnify:CR=1 FL=1|nr:TatD family hydrolase [bacterium]
MPLIDSHCHLNSKEFENNYKEIIADCLEKEIGLLNIGADFETSKRAVEIASEYPNKPIYASIGMHPESIQENFDAEKFQKLINPKTVAVGEIGLEYFFDNKQELKEKQQELFRQQLNFAIKNNLPVILHARGSKLNPYDVYEDMLDILKKQEPARRSDNWSRWSEGGEKGVVHCFSASQEIAQKFLDLGFYIGLTGLITFKNKSVDSLRQTVKMIPLERLLVETDTPYMTPEPHRGEKNLPQYTEFVARKLAAIKGVSYTEICKITTENFKKLFLKK